MAVTIERNFYTARLRAVDGDAGFPYLYMALHSLIPVFTEEVPTLATDKWWRVYVNPKFFGSLTEDEGAMVLIHEIWHPLGLDWERAEQAHVQIDETVMWNIARDIEINEGKGDFFKRLPKIPYYNKEGKLVADEPCSAKGLNMPEGLFAEQYFELLKKNRPDLRIPIMLVVVGSDDGGGDSGPDQTPRPGGGVCGSCADGHKKPWELPAPDKCDTPGQSEARTRLVQTATAQAIAEASQSRGNVPAGWQRWANRILKPKVKWQEELGPSIKGYLSQVSGGVIPTFRKIGRRQTSDPRILPPAKLKIIPRVAFILDTSGSMSDDYLAQSRAEVDGVLTSLGRSVNVTVYHTDAAAAEAQKVMAAEHLVPFGGGGTDMGAGFEAIEEAGRHNPEEVPDLIVCITDGFTPWPKHPPEVRTVVVIIGKETAGPHWTQGPLFKQINIDPPDAETSKKIGPAPNMGAIDEDED
jgi:predicted metal-dependent peptidase